MRLLAVILHDEEKCRSAIGDALRSAGKKQLPAESRELLEFVKTHLAPQLIGKLPPHLLLALVDDLAAEFAELTPGNADTVRSPFVAVTKKPSPRTVPASSAFEPASAPKDSQDCAVESPLLELEPSVDDLVRVTSAGAAFTPMDRYGLASAGQERANIVLFESDRMMRSSMARALLNAQFDVTVLDGSSDVQASVRHLKGSVVVIMDVATDRAEAALRALMDVRPSPRVLAWTNASRPLTETLFATLGVRRFGIIARMATASQLIDAVRALLRNDSPH